MFVYFDYLCLVCFVKLLAVIVLKITSGFQRGNCFKELLLFFMQMRRERLLDLSWQSVFELPVTK